MKKPTSLGLNRTGIDVSPIDSKEMIAEAERTPPSSEGNSLDILDERAVFHRVAEPIGSVPPPGTLRGMAQAGAQKIAMKRPEVFIDKLAERLAFERSGTRLYEALIGKCEARVDEAALVPLEQLTEFRDAEHRHFLLVVNAMRTLGADPTAMPPCADVAGVESLGLVQVLTDPRTSITQSIHAILVAELTDNDGWESLIELAEKMNRPEMAKEFRSALAEEQVHLQVIRDVYHALVREDARVA